MLTFFRNIRKRFVELSLYGKYLLYAIGEIGLVVVGILIALQVNNWNQNRIERDEELSIVKSLYKELLENERFLTSRINFLENRQRSGQHLLRNTGPVPGNMPYDSLLYHVVRATTTAGFSPRVSSLHRIINNEEFNLIRRDSLKLLLNEYSTLINLGINNYNTVWADNFDTLISNLFGNVNLANYQGKVYNVPVLEELDFSNLYEKNSEKILSNPEFESRIALILRKNFFTKNRLQSIKDHIYILKQYIEQHYSI